MGNRKWDLGNRKWDMRLGLLKMENLPQSTDYECDYLPSISFEKFQVVGGWLVQ